MKRLAALIPAAVALAAGVCSTPAVSASAADITLSPAETRALFGDTLVCSYKVSNSDLINSTFSYYGKGFIDDTTYSTNPNLYKFDPTNSQIIVYQSDFTDTIYDGTTSNFSLRLKPTISLSGLTNIQFSSGISCNPLFVSSLSSGSYSSLNKIEYRYKTNGTSSFYSNSSTVIWEYDSLSNRHPVGIGTVFLSSDGNTMHDVLCNMVQLKQTDTSNGFEFLIDSEYDSNGFFAFRWLTKQDDGHYYFYIACPTLSDTYVNNNPSESSGGGSETSGGGCDCPDYTDQLALILAKLDLIINNDFNFDVDLSADLSGVESRLDGLNSRLDGVNSRLDGSNSRLDGSNSRLDGVNSRLDGVNSRLDNISGELHDLNSAPSETIPNTGGENSEFDHQAEMYMSDFRNEFEDSENQVFEVIDKGTGFLGFVRQFIISSHLAQILPLVALLFIAHYVIFERGG